MPTYGQSIKTNKIPVIGLTAEASGTAPTTPTDGQLWTNTTAHVVNYWDAGATAWRPWLAIGTTAGTAADGSTVLLKANNLSDLTTPATARTNLGLGTAAVTNTGTGATNTILGNDARLTDTRTPTALSVTDASVAANAAIAESKLALATDAAAATGSRRTIGTGALQAMAGNTNLSTIAAPTTNVAMAGFKITGLGAPTANTDAARLVDVQGAAAGIDAQPSVRVASTANLAVASAVINGAVVDGVTLVTGDRILLKNQTTASENGAYIVAATGAASRAADNISPNTFWFAEEGTTNSDTQWVVTTNGPITLGTTALVITQFGAGASYVGTAGRVTVTGNAIDIASTYVGQTSLTTLGTITTGVWTGTAIAIANGGTGATTAPAARTALSAGQAGYRAVIASALVAGTPLTITHNLNTDNCIAQVRDATTGEYTYLDIIDAPATPNTLTVTAGIAYAASSLDIVIVAI